MKVGFIGLGRMGQGMARRILEAGHDLVVYNRTPDKAAALVEAGAGIAESIAAACAGREAVITMLTDDAALLDVAEQAGGIVAALPKGAVHVAMGTHGIDAMRTLQLAHDEAGQVFVAAPVLGRPDRAAAGELGIVPAGPLQALELLGPLFEAIGNKVFEAGSDPAAAAAIKIAHNFVLGCAIEVMGEGVALVRKFGVQPDVLHRVLTEGLFAAPAYKIYGEIIVEEAYDRVGVTALIGLKDANLALAAAKAAGVPLPSVDVWRGRLVDAVDHGDGERDWAVVALEQARASGLE